jgi:hypothetical protein
MKPGRNSKPKQKWTSTPLTSPPRNYATFLSLTKTKTRSMTWPKKYLNIFTNVFAHAKFHFTHTLTLSSTSWTLNQPDAVCTALIQLRGRYGKLTLVCRCAGKELKSAHSSHTISRSRLRTILRFVKKKQKTKRTLPTLSFTGSRATKNLCQNSTKLRQK